MASSEVQRTLVKSPPELWAELSDPASLARHLGHFGEIRIARIEPESTVEWEADSVQGAVHLKPSGWGTKVTLSITRREPEPEPEAEAEPDPEPDPKPDPIPAAAQEPAPKLRQRFFERLFRRRKRAQPVPEPEPGEPQAEEPLPGPTDLAAELAEIEEALAEQDEALLSDVLDRLGAAHHRPFSRG
jgi:hypothetical protein